MFKYNLDILELEQLSQQLPHDKNRWENSSSCSLTRRCCFNYWNENVKKGNGNVMFTVLQSVRMIRGANRKHIAIRKNWGQTQDKLITLSDIWSWMVGSNWQQMTDCNYPCENSTYWVCLKCRQEVWYSRLLSPFDQDWFNMGYAP